MCSTRECSQFVPTGKADGYELRFIFTMYSRGSGMMKNRYHFLWNMLPVIGLLIWGAFGITENLWYDEAYSAALVAHTPKGIISITSQDVHSPFYYLILKAFWEFFGPIVGFRCLKWFSILAIIGYLMLGKFYVKKLFGERISVFFMLFSITMPIMTVQSGNVRMYTLALFFLTLMSLLMLDILREVHLLKWFLFILTSICSVYCHAYTMLQVFFLYIIFFVTILHQKKYDLLKGFFICGIAVSALFVPWLSVTYGQMKQRVVDHVNEQKTIRYIAKTLLNCCREWFSALETPLTIVLCLEIAIGLFLGWNAIKWMKAKHNYVPVLGMLAMTLTAIVGIVISIFVDHGFLGRYVFSGFAAVMLLYAVGMEQLDSKIMKILVILSVAVCFLLQYGSELKLEYDAGLNTWKNFAEDVGPNDVIMADNVHSLYLSIYYPDNNYMIYGFMPEYAPFQNTETFTRWEQLEQYEGVLWYICSADHTPILLAEKYTWEEEISFHYMYQDFKIFRLKPVYE